MKNLNTTCRRVLPAILGVLLCGASHAFAIQLISNGGFENGFNGWTTFDQAGGDGTFQLQSGTASPINSDEVPAPPGGTYAAMTDAQGPGAHLLLQQFVVPNVITTAVLSFDLFIGNRADDFHTPDLNILTFDTPELNQQARVDIIDAAGNVFELTGLIAELFQTASGDPLVSGYTHYAIDIADVLALNTGAELMLRFAAVDNVFTLQFGVDNVSLLVNEPEVVSEPATLALLATLGLLGGASRRSRRLK